MAQVIYSEAALADLDRLAEFLLGHDAPSAPETFASLASAVAVLERHPLIGRRVRDEFRELVISRGRTGYVALYRFDPAFDVMRVLRVRPQSEAGYRE